MKDRRPEPRLEARNEQGLKEKWTPEGKALANPEKKDHRRMRKNPVLGGEQRTQHLSVRAWSGEVKNTAKIVPSPLEEDPSEKVRGDRTVGKGGGEKNAGKPKERGRPACQWAVGSLNWERDRRERNMGDVKKKNLGRKGARKGKWTNRKGQPWRRAGKKKRKTRLQPWGTGDSD